MHTYPTGPAAAAAQAETVKITPTRLKALVAKTDKAAALAEDVARAITQMTAGKTGLIALDIAAQEEAATAARNTLYEAGEALQKACDAVSAL